MIRNILDKDSRIEFLDALKKVHGGKEVVWIDMDGVVADFVPKATEHAEKMGLTFQEFADQKGYRDIEGFYRELSLIPGAQEGIKKLEDSGKYDLYFLSAPSWGNVSCFSDKRIWIEKYFPSFKKRMSLSFQKGHHMGHYLIDDRTKYGAGEFMGEHIQFGNEQYPDWDVVTDYLLNKETNPSQEAHPDTYTKPYFAIIDENFPDTPRLEQLYCEDGSKYQIDGEDVRLCIRTNEAIEIHGLLTPLELQEVLIGKYAHDSLDWLCLSEDRIKELLNMCESYKSKS